MNDDDRERDNVVEFARRRPTSGEDSSPPDRDDIPSDPFGEDGHIVAETLSAWLSGPEDFDAAQRAAVEGHLATCQVCQTTLEDLRAIVLALAALPQASAPRSFALTPEMVAPPAPVNLRETPGRPVVLTDSRPWYERQLAALRWATAVAAILFVFVVSADIVSRSPSDGGSGDDAASVMIAADDGTTATGGAADEESVRTMDEDAAQEAEEAQGSGGEASDTEADTGTGSGAGEDSTEGDPPVADDNAALMEEAEVEEAEPTPASEEPQPASGQGETATEAAAATLSDEEVIAYSESEEAADGDMAAEDAAGGDAANDEAMTGLTQEDDTTRDSTSSIAQEDDGSTWRLLQVGLALVIVWLLAAMIALPRLRPRQAGPDRDQ